MTTDYIKEILEDLKNNRSLCDCQKSDCLVVMNNLYEDIICEDSELEMEIDKYIEKWDC